VSSESIDARLLLSEGCVLPTIPCRGRAPRRASIGCRWTVICGLSVVA